MTDAVTPDARVQTQAVDPVNARVAPYVLAGFGLFTRLSLSPVSVHTHLPHADAMPVRRHHRAAYATAPSFSHKPWPEHPTCSHSGSTRVDP